MPVPDRYPAASWRPLGSQTEPLIRPRILVVHTMQGYLRGTESMFRGGGYDGTESHFGLGGPWDRDTNGKSLDGAVWQWQALTRQADANADGNGYCVSVETSDGGDPARPWSAAQVRALVALVVWWCRSVGCRPVLVTSTMQSGIGFHAQFKEWNPNGHACPGTVRLTQLTDVVLPTAARVLGGAAPANPTDTNTGDDMPLTDTDLRRIADVTMSDEARYRVRDGVRLRGPVDVLEEILRDVRGLRGLVADQVAAAVAARYPAGSVPVGQLAEAVVDEMHARLDGDRS